MSQLLQNFALATGVLVNNTTGAAEGYSSGIPQGATGVAVDDTSAIASYHMGLPLTAGGRIAVDFNNAVAEMQDGARPVDSTGRLSMSTLAISSYTAGVGYSVNGDIVAFGTGIPLGAGAFSDGYSTGFDV